MEPVTPVIRDPHSRTRTHYALIGLALSVGTTSVFLPQQGDKVSATEPIDPIATENVIYSSDLAVSSAETHIQSVVSGPKAKKIDLSRQDEIDADFPTSTQNVNQTPDAEVVPVAIEEPDLNKELAQNTSSDTLREEISRLRQKYRRIKDHQQANISQPSFLEEDQLDLQFRQTTQRVQNNLENLRRKRAEALQVRNGIAENQTNQQINSGELMAVAPLVSGSYEYDLKPRLVSPALPPLNRPETYLPKVTPIFEGYMWPAQGTLTSGYGWRWGRMHAGIDIAAAIGTPIFAAASGVVTYAGWDDSGYGNLVEIKHPDGSITLYAHNNRILVREGQQVEVGQQISEMGSTGNSTGPHLHFEIHPRGRGAENPLAYLPN
ncbi:MAG TPA: M23 family metallopeptidase [Halomicronema sp.]